MIVDRAGLERLEGDLPLAVIFEAQPVEIVLAEIDRQLRAPIVRVALEFDEASLLEGLDLVGAGAERRVERGGGEIAALPPGGREDRHADDDEMGVAAATLDEAHMNDVVALGGGGLDLLQELGVDRVALLLQHVEREGDVGRRHPRAVEEARLRPQPEAIVELVGRNAHRLREQAIDRIRLVAVGGHQRVEGRAHAGRAVALPAVDVERVEGVEVLVAAGVGDLQRQEAAGRRLRVDIGEMREVGRQGEIAERREAVGLDRIVGERGERAREKRRERAAGARLQSRPAGERSVSHRIIASAFGAIYRARRLIASDSGENEAQPTVEMGRIARQRGCAWLAHNHRPK